MKPLSLRTLPREEASLRQRIGHGLGYPFTLAGEAGELQLRLAPPPASGHRRRASHARREGYLWRRAKRC